MRYTPYEKMVIGYFIIAAIALIITIFGIAFDVPTNPRTTEQICKCEKLK